MKTSSFYDLISGFYPVIDLFLYARKKKIAGKINAFPAGELLEIGVGHGSMLPLYRQHNITGIDISRQMLAHAKKRKVHTPTVLQTMDGEQLLFPDNCFDYILLNHVLSVTDQPDRMITEAGRVLKKGGLLLIHNHFTPTHVLKYLDQFFAPLAPLFHFRSLFHLSSLPALQSLRLQYRQQSQPLGYYQFLIFSK